MGPKRARRGSRATSSRAGDAGSVISEDGHGNGVGETDRANAQREAQATTSANGAEQRASAPSHTDDDPDHVKVLLATDNHVGYMERDAVRGQDSINTFREILQLGRERDVDFILLGGDLFHENRPSRTTMHQVMGALREFTLGDRPVSIELLSDPNDGQAEGYNFPAVNYEDANLNIAIPVFSIHGNHDDPQGVGAEGALSAVDLLSVAGYINYFGKVELPAEDSAADKSSTRAPPKGGLSDVGIRIRPVLLRKGETKIALFGMGNIKDERMHYELRQARVRMYRPAENPDDWFNILTIHQNRVAHDPKAVVPETMFDNSIDLVVWGHEHEQLLEPSVVPQKKYRISQPGSSVATSLCPGEAVEKRVAIIHITKREYRMEHIPLKTVRPFVMEEIDLDEEVEAAGHRIDEKQKVTKLLKGKVRSLIARAKEEWERKQASTPASERQEMMLPLIRLRVRYTRHEMGNLVRFGQDFVDSVANPRDLLQFSKKKEDGVSLKNASAKNYIEPDDKMLTSEKLEKVSMSELVQMFLDTQQLHILSRIGLERSVTKFIDKKDKHAIGSFVEKELRSTNAGLVTADPDERDLETELKRIRGEKNSASMAAREDPTPLEDASDEEPASGAKQRESVGPSRTGVSRASERRHASLDDSVDSDDSMMDDIFDVAPSAPTRVTKRAPAKTAAKTTRGAAASSNRQPATPSGRSRQTQLMFRGNSEEDDDDEAPARTQQATPVMSSRAAALAGIGGGKKSTARGKVSHAKRTTAAARATPPRRAATAGRVAAARRASEDYVDEDDDDDDE